MIEDYLQLEINTDGVAYILLNNLNSKQNIISLKLIDYFDNIVDRIINENIAGFLPSPSVLTINPQSKGPIIVANLPTVEYKP